MTTAPEGWYPTADNAQLERYWNGEAWTDEHRDAAASAPATAHDTTEPSVAIPPYAPPAYQPQVFQQPALGQPAYVTAQPAYVAVVPAGPPNGAAMAGFLLTLIPAVLLVFFFWTVFATFLFGVALLVGFILSIVGLRKANAYAKQGLPPARRGQAVAGIVIGGIFILLDLITIIIIFSFGALLFGGAVTSLS